MSAVLRLLKPERNDESFVASFILGRPATTQRVYGNQVREFLSFANKPVDRIEASDLRGFLEACRRHELRPGTIRHKIAVVKSFFAFLAQEGDLAEDPMVRVPTPPHALPDGSRCLSGDQVAAFFGQIPRHRIVGLRDRAVFLLAANCGLRLSELSRLSVSDVGDGPEKGWRTLRIHGKGDKVREVQVRPEVWAYVMAYLERRREPMTDQAPLVGSAGGLWWRWEPWVITWTLNDLNPRVFSSRFSRKCNLVLVSQYGGNAEVWSVATKSVVSKLDVTGLMIDASFSTDEAKVIALFCMGPQGSQDYETRIWDVASGKLLKTFDESHKGRFSGYLKDGKTILFEAK